MKATFLLLALGILFLQPVVAQQFKFGVGASVANESEISTVPGGNSTVLIWGVALTPSYSFPVSKKMAVAVDILPGRVIQGRQKIIPIKAQVSS